MPALNLPTILTYESDSIKITVIKVLMHPSTLHGSVYNMRGYKLDFILMMAHVPGL
jgi:hypothetical protein